MTISTVEYLDTIDLLFVRQKINDFYNMDFANVTPLTIQKSLFEIFCIKTSDGRVGINFPHCQSVIPKGEKFYRIWRGYDFYKALTEKSFRFSDLWNNPTAPINRMNKEGEPALYLCLRSPETALFETGVKNDDIFTLFIYSAKEEIKVIEIYLGNRWSTGDGLNVEQQEKANLLNDFLFRELCRDVDENSKYLYKITNSIKHIFSNDKLYDCDGVRYISAANSKPENICMRYPNFNRKIQIDAIAKGVMTTEMKHYFIEVATVESNGNIRTSLADENFLNTYIPAALYN